MNKTAKEAVMIDPKIAPSQLFLGEITGASLCLANNTPVK
jgi:hypothetical protein